MKRRLILFAILLFALCLVTAIACADISNVQFRQERNGKVTITWSDSDNMGPYEVHWYQDNWVDWWVCDETSYPGTSATVETMVPGATYQVNIKNSVSSVTVPYTVPKGTFSDWKSGKRLELDVGDFDYQTMSRYKTFRLKMHYPRLGSSRMYNWVLALQTPIGYAGWVYHNEYLKVEPKYSYLYWDLDLANWIDNIEGVYGGKVPSGIYYAEVYLDGNFYASWGFRVYGN